MGYNIQEAFIVMDSYSTVIDWFDTLEEAEAYVEELEKADEEGEGAAEDGETEDIGSVLSRLKRTEEAVKLNNIHDSVFVCPKCWNRTLYPVPTDTDDIRDIIGIGYHDLCICEECGAELLAEPQSDNTVRFVEVGEE